MAAKGYPAELPRPDQAKSTNEDEFNSSSTSRRRQTGSDGSQYQSLSDSYQSPTPRDEQSSPIRGDEEEAPDWKKTGAIPKRKTGGDLISKGSFAATMIVSPREVEYDQSQLDEAGDSHRQANSSLSGNSRPSDQPITTTWPSSYHHDADAISKTLRDSENISIRVNETADDWQPPSGPIRRNVVYGDAAAVTTLAERLGKLTDGAVPQQSQDGVIMNTKFVIQNGKYRNGHEYVQGELLGFGKDSEVWTIHDSKTKAIAARKIVKSENFAPNEAIIWISLNHDNIVRLLALVRTGDKVMFISEYNPGYKTLQKHVETRRVALGQGEMVEVGQQLFEALTYLEKEKIIHRDIHPSNILVKPRQSHQTYGEHVKLLDFGISVKLEGATHAENELSGIGNASYRAPEIECDEPTYDTRVDVWGGICCLMFSLKGWAPWTGTVIKEYPEVDIPATTNSIVREPIDSAHEVEWIKRPWARDVLQMFKNIPRKTVEQLYKVPAITALPPAELFPVELSDSKESSCSDKNLDDPIRDLDDQLDELNMNNQPAPVHDDIGGGDARLHGVKDIFVTVLDENCKIKLPKIESVIWVAEALYTEINTPFTFHDTNGRALDKDHTFSCGNHTIVAVAAPDGGDWLWRMPNSGKVEYPPNI